uniref:Uncharacterized protein n=1 Tax=Heterorhabditis bacteriophora TaxID=37862 RepID=A0A1I7W7J1_HETBA
MLIFLKTINFSSFRNDSTFHIFWRYLTKKSAKSLILDHHNNVSNQSTANCRLHGKAGCRCRQALQKGYYEFPASSGRIGNNEEQWTTYTISINGI